MTLMQMEYVASIIKLRRRTELSRSLWCCIRDISL